MKKIALSLLLTLISLPLFAQDAAAYGSSKGLIAIAAGLGIGMAVLGAGFGMSKIGGNAMDGIARNPKAKDEMFIPMILGLAFVEAAVILGFVICILLVQKV